MPSFTDQRARFLTFEEKSALLLQLFILQNIPNFLGEYQTTPVIPPIEIRQHHGSLPWLVLLYEMASLWEDL